VPADEYECISQLTSLVLTGTKCPWHARKGGAHLRPPPLSHQCEASIESLISAIALPGLRCLGHVLEQFMMVLQR